MRAHGASVRSLDNHHWQITRGDCSGVWMLGEGDLHNGGHLGSAAILRLRQVLRQTGLLREEPNGAEHRAAAAMRAAILWVGDEATRVFWINDHGLGEGPSCSLHHWLLGEVTLHRRQQPVPYLRRILALLERIERVLLVGQENPKSAGAGAASARRDLEELADLLSLERPDLRERIVAILTLESPHLDDDLLFAMARDYLQPPPCGEAIKRGAASPS